MNAPAAPTSRRLRWLLFASLAWMLLPFALILVNAALVGLAECHLPASAGTPCRLGRFDLQPLMRILGAAPLMLFVTVPTGLVGVAAWAAGRLLERQRR